MTEAEINAVCGHLLALEANWDSYGANPINPRSVELAARIARAFPEKQHLAMVPTCDGYVQVEWHQDGEDVEIEVWAEDS